MSKKKVSLDRKITLWVYDSLFDAVYCVQINGKPSESIESFLKKTSNFFTSEESKSFFRSITECDNNAHNGGWCMYYADVPVCYIWLKSLGTGTLVHETHHAVTHILTSKGIPRSKDTEEVFAYVHDWLCKTIVNKAYAMFDKLGAK